MSLFARLLQAVRSWRRRRGGPKTVRYAGIAMEQLDHRQLLSVNFTGNVPIDFPATQSPGVVVLPDNPLVQHPAIAPAIAPIVKVSGFDISGIRVSYSPFDDTLSIGLDQPQSGNHTGEVIAGDADNNGNSGTVNPAVTSTPGFSTFQDPPDFGGSEHMGAFIDFTGSGNAQIVAGFSPVPTTPTATDPSPPKPYRGCSRHSRPDPTPLRLFGTELPQFEGNLYTQNSIAHPNLEFSIKDFSQLYKQETGQTLTSSSVIYVGGFGGSGEDTGIGEAFFPEQPVKLGAATLPNTCPPASPPILINPHEHRVIDTSHRDLVRVYRAGNVGFQCDLDQPRHGLARWCQPDRRVPQHFPHSEFLNETFVFVGKDINLPAGYTTATFTAQTFSGQQITSSKQVLNIPFSAKVPGRLHFLMDKGTTYPGLRRLEKSSPGSVNLGNTTQPVPASVKVNLTSKAAIRDLRVNYRDQVSTTGTTTPVALPRTVVSLAASRRGGERASKAPRSLMTRRACFLHAVVV